MKSSEWNCKVVRAEKVVEDLINFNFPSLSSSTFCTRGSRTFQNFGATKTSFHFKLFLGENLKRTEVFIRSDGETFKGSDISSTDDREIEFFAKGIWRRLKGVPTSQTFSRKKFKVGDDSAEEKLNAHHKLFQTQLFSAHELFQPTIF